MASTTQYITQYKDPFTKKWNDVGYFKFEPLTKAQERCRDIMKKYPNIKYWRIRRQIVNTKVDIVEVYQNDSYKANCCGN